MRVVVDSGPIQEAYLELFEQRARSSQFDTANPAAKAVPALGEMLGEHISPEHAFRIVAAVIATAGQNAFDALSLRNNGFYRAEELRKVAAKFGAASKDAASTILEEYCVAEYLSEK